MFFRLGVAFLKAVRSLFAKNAKMRQSILEKAGAAASRVFKSPQQLFAYINSLPPQKRVEATYSILRDIAVFASFNAAIEMIGMLASDESAQTGSTAVANDLKARLEAEQDILVNAVEVYNNKDIAKLDGNDELSYSDFQVKRDAMNTIQRAALVADAATLRSAKEAYTVAKSKIRKASSLLGLSEDGALELIMLIKEIDESYVEVLDDNI